MDFDQILVLSVLAIIVIMFVSPILFIAMIYRKNRKQTQHSLLRGDHWFIGIIRYLIEPVGPEFRFYITDDDNSGKPLSRIKYIAIVKASKYMKTLISFGSKRDFSKPGFYLKNSMLPKLGSEISLDNSYTISTKRYKIKKEKIVFRNEVRESVEIHPWLLKEEDSLILGANRKHPWHLRGIIGMSAMSFGALGQRAITALSQGIGMAGGSWMNTGEGGLSEYHLSGNCDIIYQIGPGLFGVRDPDGNLDKEKLREKGAIPQVKAFELKLGQGAKIRGGHIEANKVNEEVARMRGVEPWKNIDSPNRFPFIHSISDLFDFVELIQEETGLPVGCKIVLAANDVLDEFCEEYQRRGRGPDFITIDGAEGGTGATYMEMADSLGLPINIALRIADDTLRKFGIRDRIRIIASGKIHLPDEIAIALCLGADMINIARGFMVTIGCIMSQKCHTNECPVGVATTNPHQERALHVEEKKYRVMNYIITLRAGLFNLCAACGLEQPLQFERKHLIYQDIHLQVKSGDELFPFPENPEENI